MKTLSERTQELLGEDSPIIFSLLDLDLYKISMQAYVLELYPKVEVEYRFTNRNLNMRFSVEMFEKLKQQIYALEFLRLNDREYKYLKDKIRYFKPSYLEYLKNFKFKPKEQIELSLKNGELSLSIHGLWVETILYETMIMSIISELYFKMVDTNWSYDGQYEKAENKFHLLNDNGCLFADFGTRRRRSFSTQVTVLNAFVNCHNEWNRKSSFVGTSNVRLAMSNNIKPVGTYAHELVMAQQVLNSIGHCNLHAMETWSKVYEADLGIALTDTITTNKFLEDFGRKYVKLYDGVRHDSADEIEFADKVIAHYKSFNIDPLTKTIVFSNGLDVDRAIEVNQYCKGKIRCSFGIGTTFTNDFQNSNPLNIVIKLYKVNGIPVVKLSDDDGKASGDKDAVRVTKWIVDGTPLDSE